MKRVDRCLARFRLNSPATVPLRALSCLGAGLVFLVVQETASRSSLIKALQWVYYYPTSAAFNWVLICSILAFFAALSGKAVRSLSGIWLWPEEAKPSTLSKPTKRNRFYTL